MNVRFTILALDSPLRDIYVEEIHHLIDADSFKRFLKSNLYKEHLRMESEKLKAKLFKVT